MWARGGSPACFFLAPARAQVWAKLHEEHSPLRWVLLRVAPPSRGKAGSTLVIEAHGDAPLAALGARLAAAPSLAFILLRADGVDSGAPLRIKTMILSYLPATAQFRERIAFGELSKCVVKALPGHAFHQELTDVADLDEAALEKRLKSVGGAFQCSSFLWPSGTTISAGPLAADAPTAAPHGAREAPAAQPATAPEPAPVPTPVPTPAPAPEPAPVPAPASASVTDEASKAGGGEAEHEGAGGAGSSPHAAAEGACAPAALEGAAAPPSPPAAPPDLEGAPPPPLAAAVVPTAPAGEPAPKASSPPAAGPMVPPLPAALASLKRGAASKHEEEEEEAEVEGNAIEQASPQVPVVPAASPVVAERPSVVIAPGDGDADTQSLGA